MWARFSYSHRAPGLSNHQISFYVWGAVKWKMNTRYEVTMEFIYSKVIARSVNTFIPLGDETINSSLVDRGRSLMDPQPHLLLHFLIWIKPTSTNVFLQVVKNVEVTRGKIWAVRRILKCFPAKFLKLIPHQIDSMGRALSIKRIIPSESIPGHFDVGVSQHSQPPRNEPHLSALLCLPPFLMKDERTLQ